MIRVDDRAGSDKLIPELRKITPKGTVKKTRLNSADAAWESVKEESWGVEVKHLNDVLQCMQNGRFVSQLRKMQKQYDHYWLLIVDEFRADKEGALEYLKRYGRSITRWFRPFGPKSKGPITYAGLMNWLTTMDEIGGCKVWHVQNDRQAAQWIAAKYQWCQKKKHKSLDVFDQSRPAPKKKGSVRFIGRPNEIARCANAIVDKIGWDKAKALSYHFTSVREFVNAEEEELMKVKGVGPVLAQRVVESVTKQVGKSRRKKRKRKRGE